MRMSSIDVEFVIQWHSDERESACEREHISNCSTIRSSEGESHSNAFHHENYSQNPNAALSFVLSSYFCGST